MHIVDFMVDLGAKFTPVQTHSLQTMKIQLTNTYDQKLNSYKMKTEKNEAIKTEIEILNHEKERAESLNEMDKASDIAHRMAEMKKQVDSPTLLERAVGFFDKPMVRFGLMIAFALLASLIARWLLRKTKDEDLDLEQEHEPQPQAGYHFNQPPPYYGHYNYGYQPQPPPYGYQQPKSHR